MTEQVVVGFIIMVIGGFQAVRPDLMLRFQVWTQQLIMRAKYEPSRRTHTIVRYIGVAIFLMGLFVTAGVLK